jgi:hypothetical protein
MQLSETNNTLDKGYKEKGDEPIATFYNLDLAKKSLNQI